MGVPVDGGWGWMVVLGAFLNLFICLGIAKSLGIVFVALLENYGSSATNTSVMFSLLGGIGLFSAPFCNSLAEIFGFRQICMTGAVLASLGLFIASFARSLPAVIYPFGIISGLGIGMVLNPAPVLAAKYFNKKRALANGLIFAGTGFGGILFPYIMHAIVREYTLTQSLLILSGFLLHTLVGTALFRPISFYSKTNELDVQADELDLEVIHEGKELTDFLPSHKKTTAMVDSIDSLNYSDCYTVTSEESMYFSAINLATLSIVDIPAEFTKPGKDLVTKKWTFWSVFRRLWTTKNTQGEVIPLIDVRLYKYPQFRFMSLACFLSMFGFYVGMMTPAHAESLGVKKSDVAVLLSVMGVSDTVGRLFVGLVSDAHWMKPHRALFGTFYLLVCSISCLASVYLALDFWGQAIFLFVYMLCFGAFTALVIVVLGDIVGTHRLSGAWGIILFVSGIAHVTAPLMIGVLRDSFGDFRPCYLINSGLMLLATVSMALVYFHSRFCAK